MPGIFDSEIFDSGYFDTGTTSGDGRYLSYGPDAAGPSEANTFPKHLGDPMLGSTVEVLDHLSGFLKQMMEGIERRRLSEQEKERERAFASREPGGFF